MTTGALAPWTEVISVGVSTSPSCPAYWPELVWQIHHPTLGTEPPGVDPRIEGLDSLFAAIAIRELTWALRGPEGRIDPKRIAALREQVRPFIETQHP